MTEPTDFLNTDIVHVSAAIVGISKARWTGINEGEATESAALAKMREHLFDVLPIMHGQSVREYFTTKQWNDFSRIEKRSITHRDVIPLRTSIRDVIKGFVAENRHFYFLTNAARVAGLISVANLNCREVSVFLYGMLSELEIALGELISRNADEQALIDYVRSKQDPAKKSEILERYERDVSKGIDAPFVGYLYLSDLTGFVKSTGLCEPLGYSKSAFKEGFGPLIDLRNAVAHPNQSIISTAESVERLWRNIDRLEDALFRLRAASLADATAPRLEEGGIS